MKDEIEQRVLEIAEYIINQNATVRAAAKVFHVSKSTVHKDMVERLQRINLILSRQVREVLDRNMAERHIRGGRATGEKYHKNNTKVS